jgi:hypothetical protein
MYSMPRLTIPAIPDGVSGGFKGVFRNMGILFCNEKYGLRLE